MPIADHFIISIDNILTLNILIHYSISKFQTYISYSFIDGWTMDDLIYEWKAEEPVQIVDNLNLPRFKLEHYDTDHCNTLTNTG